MSVSDLEKTRYANCSEGEVRGFWVLPGVPPFIAFKNAPQRPNQKSIPLAHRKQHSENPDPGER